MALLWLVACAAPSLVDTQQAWKVYLDSLPSCETDADCVVIEPGCPLACYDAIPVGFVGEATAFASALAEDYRTPLRPCTYECEEPPVPICSGVRRCATGAVP